MFVIKQQYNTMDTSKINKKELLEKCKEMGFTKYTSKNKSQLIELINSKQTITSFVNKEKVISIDYHEKIKFIDLFCGIGSFH